MTVPRRFAYARSLRAISSLELTRGFFQGEQELASQGPRNAPLGIEGLPWRWYWRADGHCVRAVLLAEPVFVSLGSGTFVANADEYLVLDGFVVAVDQKVVFDRFHLCFDGIKAILADALSELYGTGSSAERRLRDVVHFFAFGR